MAPKVSRWHKQKCRVAPLLHAAEGAGVEACHDALLREPFWLNLRPEGYTADPASAAHAYELRRCPQCGASLAKRVTRTSVFGVLREVSGMLARSLEVLSASPPHRPGGNIHA